MKLMGAIGCIDDLGRVVIPKEMRKNLNIVDGDLVELFIIDGMVYWGKHYSEGIHKGLIEKSGTWENARDRKYCAWTIEDAMNMYPDMTEEQAIAVMNLVEKQADYDIGVTYNSIRDAVDCICPDMKSADSDDEASCE